MALPALAVEAEAHHAAPHLHVSVAQRGDAVAPVLAGVFLAAGTEKADREDAQHAGQDAFPTEVLAREVSRDPVAELWQRTGESDQSLVLATFPACHRAGMVE